MVVHAVVCPALPLASGVDGRRPLAAVVVGSLPIATGVGVGGVLSVTANSSVSSSTISRSATAGLLWDIDDDCDSDDATECVSDVVDGGGGTDDFEAGGSFVTVSVTEHKSASV